MRGTAHCPPIWVPIAAFGDVLRLKSGSTLPSSTNLAETDFVAAVRSAIQALADEDSTKIGAYTNLFAYRCAFACET
jgi:hypothetical protein